MVESNLGYLERIWESSLTSGGNIPQKNGEKKLTVVWIDENIAENEENIKQFKISLFYRIGRIVPIDKFDRFINLLIEHFLPDIDLFITSGKMGEKLCKYLDKKKLNQVPNFQIAVYCFDVKKNQKWASKRGIVRLVTNKIKAIERLLKEFKKSRDEELDKNNKLAEFTRPFDSFEDAVDYIPIRFIRWAPAYLRGHPTRDYILRNVRKAAYSINPQTVKDEKNFFFAETIEQNMNRIKIEKMNYFKIYSMESFIYKEVNRRLRKYLNQLPPDIFSHKDQLLNEQNVDDSKKEKIYYYDHTGKKVKMTKYYDEAYEKLKCILPFVYELTKSIVDMNKNGHHLVKSNRIVHRGINLEEEQIKIFDNSAGQKIGFPSFTSATKEKIENLPFFNTKNTILDIRIPKNKHNGDIFPIYLKGIEYTDSPDEKEILFPPGCTFEVIKTTRENGKFHIELEYNPLPTPPGNKIPSSNF